MCVGIPSKVISIKEKRVKVKQGDHTHWLDISSIDDKVKIGDYLLSYQEAAINKIPEHEAKKILSLISSF